MINITIYEDYRGVSLWVDLERVRTYSKHGHNRAREDAQMIMFILRMLEIRGEIKFTDTTQEGQVSNDG